MAKQTRLHVFGNRVNDFEDQLVGYFCTWFTLQIEGRQWYLCNKLLLQEIGISFKIQDYISSLISL